MDSDSENRSDSEAENGSDFEPENGSDLESDEDVEDPPVTFSSKGNFFTFYSIESGGMLQIKGRLNYGQEQDCNFSGNQGKVRNLLVKKVSE